jgi:peptidoglycan/LPS O-acetylase OafA/YrhL
VDSLVDASGKPRAGDGRLRVLDGLRFFAAFAVVIFHFTGRDSVAWGESVEVVFPFLSSFTAYGGFGPYLFFMISGFVVLMSAWGRPVHSFVASRVARLYPAYWIAVVVTGTVLFFNQDVLNTWERLEFSGVAMNMTMFQSAFGVGHVDGVFWTLWVELKFYLLVGLMALIGITRKRMLALCLAWPVMGALAVGTNATFLGSLLEPNFAPFFCIGILIYLVYREGWSACTGLLLALNYSLALWVCDAYYIPVSEDYHAAPITFGWVALLLTLSVAALAAATLTRLNRVDWRWLTLLGGLTYPLYLIHEVPGWIMLHALTPVLNAYVAVALVTLVMLVASYLVLRFVETPFGPRLRRSIERDLAKALEQHDFSLPREEPARRASTATVRRPHTPVQRSHVPTTGAVTDPARVRPADVDVRHDVTLVPSGR